MKKYISIILFAFNVVLLYSQEKVAYYDALKLSSDTTYLESRQSDTLFFKPNEVQLKILMKYISGYEPGDTLTKEQIINAYKENPFITISEPKVILHDSKITADKYSVGSLGGLDVTTFAQGLSQFMITRAKAELNAAFFERFKKFAIENDEIGLLFPVTTNLLSFQYTEMISQLRDAFYEDLNNLPDNIITFLQEGDDFQYLREHNPDFIIALECMKLVRELDYLSPPDFLAQLPSVVTDEAMKAAGSDKEKLKKVKNFKVALQLTSIFSESFRDTSMTRNWVSSTDFKKDILDDPIAFQIYLGLVYQKIKKVEIGEKSLADEIKNNRDEIFWYKNRISELVYLANKVDYSYKEIKTLAEKDKKVGNEQIYSYINTSLEIAEFGNKFIEHYADYETYKKFDDYLSITKNANDIYRYVYQKEYGSVITATADLLDDLYGQNKIMTKIYKVNYHLLEDKYKSDAKEIDELIEIKENKFFSKKRKNVREEVLRDLKAIPIGDRKEINKEYVYVELHKKMMRKGGEKDNWIKDFRKYGTFMANMVKAETPEEVANIIEATALPVGSSSIKRNLIGILLLMAI